MHCLFLFECAPTFILYHQHSACWSGLFNYFLLCHILGDVENCFGVVVILFGGGVIANIGGGGGGSTPRKIRLCFLI